jgi:hypothetical protein
MAVLFWKTWQLNDRRIIAVNPTARVFIENICACVNRRAQLHPLAEDERDCGAIC